MNQVLDAAYARWRDAPLPPGTARDELDELHADLATVDLWVADMVIPYVESGTRFPLKVDIAAGIRRIQKGIRELRESLDGDDAALLEEYAAYVRLLDAVFDAYQRDLSVDQS